MLGTSRIIKSDLYGIATRIKQIDKGYYIVFNYKTNKYEVHNKNQGHITLCLTLPYNRLDYRALKLVQKTRIERMDALIKEIEEHNNKLERQNRRNVIKRAEYNAERALSSI